MPWLLKHQRSFTLEVVFWVQELAFMFCFPICIQLFYSPSTRRGLYPRQTEMYATCSNWCLFSTGWTPAILAPTHPAGYKALIFICLLSLVLTFFFPTCSLNSVNLGWVSLLLYTSQWIQYVKIPRQGHSLLRFRKMICSEWYNWKYWHVSILLNVSSHFKDAVLYLTPTGSHWRVLSWESEQQTLLLKKKITDAVFLGKQTLIRVFVSWELIRDMINNLHKPEWELLGIKMRRSFLTAGRRQRVASLW